jgi:hypothetical protein
MSERGGRRGIVDLQAVVLLGVEFFTSVGLFVVGYGTHILYSCLSLSTTCRWPILRAETCSCIPNVLFCVKIYGCVLTI